jgi:hypothetical protein
LGTSKCVGFSSCVTEHKHCFAAETAGAQRLCHCCSRQRLLECRDFALIVTAGAQRLFYCCLRQRLLKIRECALVVAAETDKVQKLIPCDTAEVCALVV